MTTVTQWMDRNFYPDFQSRWDDRLFRQRILTHLKPEFQILDIGAGAGIVPEMDFKGLASRVVGVDLDPRVVHNQFLDEGRVADAEALPYPDATFDLVFADNVMEHIERPECVFREIARVLKPTGILLFKTPNALHYMPLIARMTPHGFHRFVNKLRGRATIDTFPTRYRVNTPWQIRKFAAASGFEVEQLGQIEGRPEYLRMWPPLYMLGFLYERLVNSMRLLSPFRVLLIAELRKC
ncbi:MAG: class I SAM-dependent methyltransferase [Hyphomonadaceae bacterium]